MKFPYFEAFFTGTFLGIACVLLYLAGQSLWTGQPGGAVIALMIAIVDLILARANGERVLRWYRQRKQEARHDVGA